MHQLRCPSPFLGSTILKVGLSLLPDLHQFGWTAGDGLFATKRIKDGACLGVYDGPRFATADEANYHASRGNNYIMGLVDGSNYHSSLFRYANDPCSSSMYNCRVNCRADGTISIYAIVDIKPGDEIFFPYGSSYYMPIDPTAELQQHLQDVYGTVRFYRPDHRGMQQPGSDWIESNSESDSDSTEASTSPALQMHALHGPSLHQDDPKVEHPPDLADDSDSDVECFVPNYPGDQPPCIQASNPPSSDPPAINPAPPPPCPHHL